MCPLFKKKDPTDIRNYRPITLLNTDYKLLTKVLALQLLDHVNQLIHPDQAGFIPNRSIFDHIRLAKAILNYCYALTLPLGKGSQLGLGPRNNGQERNGLPDPGRGPKDR